MKFEELKIGERFYLIIDGIKVELIKMEEIPDYGKGPGNALCIEPGYNFVGRIFLVDNNEMVITNRKAA